MSLGCQTCGFITCVCNVIERHDKNCSFRVSMTCPVEIECSHGYGVCPKCDPCTCGAGVETEDFGDP